MQVELDKGDPIASFQRPQVIKTEISVMEIIFELFYLHHVYFGLYYPSALFRPLIELFSPPFARSNRVHQSGIICSAPGLEHDLLNGSFACLKRQ